LARLPLQLVAVRLHALEIAVSRADMLCSNRQQPYCHAQGSSISWRLITANALLHKTSAPHSVCDAHHVRTCGSGRMVGRVLLLQRNASGSRQLCDDIAHCVLLRSALGKQY
jgi:hypothetical protein